MAQPFEGVENDGTAAKQEILLWLGGTHTQADSGGGYQPPDAVCVRQGKKPGSRRLADGTDDVALDTVAGHLGRDVLDRRQFAREIAAGGFQQQ